MGYTHYWTQVRDFTRDEWPEITGHISAILADAEENLDVLFANGAGDSGTRPDFEADTIMFNGSGDNGHETFAIYRTRLPKKDWESMLGWDFCKTARKPYDIAVTAALCYLASIPATHKVNSDGKGSDFLAGLALARHALPQFDNQLDIPMGIMESDRWCPPWPQLFTDDFHFGFCVDGHAYVRRLDKSGGSYRFSGHAEAARFVARHGDLFDATGFFDEKRRNMLARRQAEVLGQLIAEARQAPVAEGRSLQPPAYVRPGEVPAVNPFNTIASLLERGTG